MKSQILSLLIVFIVTVSSQFAVMRQASAYTDKYIVKKSSNTDSRRVYQSSELIRIFQKAVSDFRELESVLRQTDSDRQLRLLRYHIELQNQELRIKLREGILFRSEAKEHRLDADFEDTKAILVDLLSLYQRIVGRDNVCGLVDPRCANLTKDQQEVRARVLKMFEGLADRILSFYQFQNSKYAEELRSILSDFHWKTIGISESRIFSVSDFVFSKVRDLSMKLERHRVLEIYDFNKLIRSTNATNLRTRERQMREFQIYARQWLSLNAIYQELPSYSFCRSPESDFCRTSIIATTMFEKVSKLRNLKNISTISSSEKTQYFRIFDCLAATESKWNPISNGLIANVELVLGFKVNPTTCTFKNERNRELINRIGGWESDFAEVEDPMASKLGIEISFSRPLHVNVHEYQWNEIFALALELQQITKSPDLAFWIQQSLSASNRSMAKASRLRENQHLKNAYLCMLQISKKLEFIIGSNQTDLLFREPAFAVSVKNKMSFAVKQFVQSFGEFDSKAQCILK